ncbi:DUF1372 family protein [Streptococcus porci]|uniref:DUF1372 family protein n=1 Tax=Streptococcus porci TaxID=502567 RepID=UPI000416AD6F|nr:DUF1372 family protein [Streptococcus porci]
MSKDYKLHLLILNIFILGFVIGYFAPHDEPRPIVYTVDNAGGLMTGKITDKEIIDGRYTVTVGAYGKFLVTKEQYESLKIGDPIPEYLKGRGS